MRVLVTGASGLVGRAVVERLLSTAGVVPVAAVRRGREAAVRSAEVVTVADLSTSTDWSQALGGVDVLVHAAARVHVMHDTAEDPLEEFRRVNVQGTLHLAREAAQHGVKRFVFISSIKVNGEATPIDQPFTADDAAAPVDAYGISKMEAESGLRAIAAETGLEVTIIRPPLVYGPGVKANFRSMMKWLARGVPLPLGAIHNRRSLVSIDNLVDLVVTCLDHPAAADQVFLVSDGEDLSTTQLLTRLGLALGKPARLLPVPMAVLKMGAMLVGKPDVARRLCGSLRVDIEKTKVLLNWRPLLSVDDGLQKAAKGFSSEASI